MGRNSTLRAARQNDSRRIVVARARDKPRSFFLRDDSFPFLSLFLLLSFRLHRSYITYVYSRHELREHVRFQGDGEKCTHFAARFTACQTVRAATQDARDAAAEIAGHEAVDDGIQGAVRVSQEQAIRQCVRYRSPFFCEQFPNGLFVASLLILGVCACVRVTCRAREMVRGKIQRNPRNEMPEGIYNGANTRVNSRGHLIACCFFFFRLFSSFVFFP